MWERYTDGELAVGTATDRNDDMPDEPTERPGSSAVALAWRYVLGLTAAQLLTAAEVAAVTISLGRQTVTAPGLLTGMNLVLLVIMFAAGTFVTTFGGYQNIAPSLRWFTAGVDPDERQRRSAINLVRRQSVILVVTWAVGGLVVITANAHAGAIAVALLVLAVLFGGTSSFSTSVLFTQRIVRPIVASANRGFIIRERAPGVVARLVTMWLVNSALPSLAIALLLVCHAYGWFIPTTASVVVPVVVLTLVNVALGLRALILVARSISDPVGDVVGAMAEVERGELGRTVDVYEQSEIGRLQHGFNRMVAGLIERERLRDLFGRHVGPDVARLAIEADEFPTSEVRDVAILFIDLADSTQLATNHTPQQVADVLNAFFRIVVAAVDEHHGLINKFQGDAALAVFGAPVQTDGAATAALETARELCAELKKLPSVDFGIGVSAGAVFAGNIGAENRYEYTVIGDPVNEAARLADVAKSLSGRTAVSGAVIARADDCERDQWTAHDSVVLRGRTEATQVSVPFDENGGHDQRP
jgi:adenylate cyclase